MKQASRIRILILTALWALPQLVHGDALPTGGQITAGAGAIAQSGNAMTVTQDSDRMITQWQSFNIGADAQVQFLQPSASSVALNRVLDGKPSEILGTLTANGQIYLLNAGGILFGHGAQVDVGALFASLICGYLGETFGALFASTLDMSDKDFLSGRDVFSNGGKAGPLINQGDIKGGVVALIAPQVRNEGTITAHRGSVVRLSSSK